MGFQSGLSGLNAASQNLDVIGNNVANASVVGFKTSRTLFSDVYAASLNGAGANAIGIGTKVADIQQQFTQGNITVTNNPLDIAINGGGFFRMSDNGTVTYSRNGQFHFNEDGYIVNSDNLRLTGYGVIANMLAVPITGFWVMPWLIAALILMPFGLESWALEGQGKLDTALLKQRGTRRAQSLPYPAADSRAEKRPAGRKKTSKK